jgi:transcriptional regulator with XRE-family HTH domain
MKYRLADAIRRKGIKQKDLAALLGVSTATISRVLSGQQFLDFDLAVKACEILDVTLEWLAYGQKSSSETEKKNYYRDSERREIEYLVSILEKAEYRAVIVALEGIIELRFEQEEEQVHNPTSS